MNNPKKPQEDIEALIAEFKQSGMRELHVRSGDVEIYLSADPNAPGLDAEQQVKVTTVVPATPAPTAAPAATPAVSPDIPAGAVVVKAPYLGTFYRSPKPGAPVYVDVGSVVTAETELCLVEVMKLFTAVRADVAGTIHAILASDGQMVEADQPLFVVIPG